MARSRGRSAAPRAQTRSSSTMSMPRQAPAPVAAPAPSYSTQRQPGLFSQMASTAAGVAVGSAVGHTVANSVGSLFGGGSSAPAEPQYAQQQAAEPLQRNTSCEESARGLTQCLEQNNGDARVCQWYMDQLKSCLAASSGSLS